MEAVNTTLNKIIPINFEDTTLEFKLDGKLQNIYKIDNRYYYFCLEKKNITTTQLSRK